MLEEFGYDLKFACHLIRLLTEGIGLLVEGKLTMPLTNRELLKDIKKGRYSLQEVLDYADRYESQVEEAYIRSNLPHTPDTKAINKLQISMLEDYYDYKH